MARKKDLLAIIKNQKNRFDFHEALLDAMRTVNIQSQLPIAERLEIMSFLEDMTRGYRYGIHRDRNYIERLEPWFNEDEWQWFEHHPVKLANRMIEIYTKNRQVS